MTNKWQMKSDKWKVQKGFTLVELLVVITILGILATIGLQAFTSSQARGRDVERKSDLKQISSALELFYSDYGKYPSSDTSNGEIKGCPYNITTGGGTDCQWGVKDGTGTFTDGKTTYFQTLPKDPSSNMYYFYRVVPSTSNQAYQLYTYLENSQDQSRISGLTYSCGPSHNCNFAITSANATP